MVRAQPLPAVGGHEGGVAAHGIAVDAGVAAHDAAQGEHVGGGVGQIVLDLGQGFEEDVHALVVEFVAPGDEHDARVFRQLPAQQAAGAGQDGRAVGRWAIAIHGKVGNDAQVEAVGRDDVGLAAQDDACFFGGDVAHRGEAVGLPGGDGLHGELGRDAERGRLAARVEIPVVQHAVEILAVAGKGAAEHGGVGREDRAHGRAVALEVEQARAAHPLVELGYGRGADGLEQVLVEGGDDLAAGRGEHDGLDVVPAAGHGVHAEGLPVLEEQLVLVVAVLEADQNGLGVARDFPAAEAALEVVGVQNLAHGLDERVAALLEVDVVAEVGAEQPVVLAEVVDGLQGFAAHDGVDAADLVADFPRRFEEGDVAVVHSMLLREREGCRIARSMS